MRIKLNNAQAVMTALVASFPEAVAAPLLAHRAQLPVPEVQRWLDQLVLDGVAETRLSTVPVAPGVWAKIRYYEPAETAIAWVKMLGIAS